MALAAADKCTMITDAQGSIVWVNAAFTRLTGYASEEVSGHNPRLLKSGKTDRMVYKELWDTIRSGRVWRGELVNRRKDGSLYAEEQTVTPVQDESGRVSYFIAITHDVTARKRAEEDLRKLNEKLEQRVRERTAALLATNRELEAFAYSVSHDLRAPLRAIDGFSVLLLQKYGSQLDAGGRHYLDRVRAGTVRMQELIDDLLCLSHVVRSEVRRERVDLSTLAEMVAEELRKTRTNRQVDFVIAPGLFAEVDVHLVRLALENLLGNAWKYTSKHPAARIEFGVTERDGRSVFFVRDDGAGFDMAYVEKLFDPFQRLHAVEEFEGSGIGLAIVQRIISRHGGRIWAEGAVEQGATFYFTLAPLASS
jgi:PAS domain S-box-containing protein